MNNLIKKTLIIGGTALSILTTGCYIYNIKQENSALRKSYLEIQKEYKIQKVIYKTVYEERDALSKHLSGAKGALNKSLETQKQQEKQLSELEKKVKDALDNLEKYKNKEEQKRKEEEKKKNDYVNRKITLTNLTYVVENKEITQLNLSLYGAKTEDVEWLESFLDKIGKKTNKQRTEEYRKTILIYQKNIADPEVVSDDYWVKATILKDKEDNEIFLNCSLKGNREMAMLDHLINNLPINEEQIGQIDAIRNYIK